MEPGNKQKLFYQILFALCIGVPYINIYELTVVVWGITALITIKSRYSLTIIQAILYFVAIIAIAAIVTYFKNYYPFLIFKDFSYLIKPVLGMVVGYQLYTGDSRKAFKTLINTGIIIAVVHLTIILYSVAIYSVRNIHQLREYAGYFSDYEVYALIAIIFSKQLKLNYSPKTRMAIILIIAISSALYVSRTNFIQFIVLYLAMKDFLTLKKKSLLIMGSIFIVSLAGYAYIYNMELARNGSGLEAFLFKIKNAPIESFKTKINTEDYKDFNDNFRSYENIITIRNVAADGTSAIAFGKGLGSRVDVGSEIYTNDGEWIRYLPIVHNGYTTVFMKTGIAGLLLSILFIIFLFRKSRNIDAQTLYMSRLMRGTAVFMIISMWVFLGLYQKYDVKSIIIGFLFCMIHNTRKEHQQISLSNEN